MMAVLFIVFMAIVVGWVSTTSSDVFQPALLPSAVHEINVALLLPYDNIYLFSYDKAKVALEMAAADVDRDGNFFSQHNVSFILRSADAKCNAIEAPLRSFDFYQRKQADVFFGPVDDNSLGQVSRYAMRWNIPVISSGGFAHDFRWVISHLMQLYTSLNVRNTRVSIYTCCLLYRALKQAIVMYIGLYTRNTLDSVSYSVH